MGSFRRVAFADLAAGKDLVHTAQGAGLEPGSEAPDFDLEAIDGTRVRLSDLRGRPVLLHFGSGT